MSLSEEYGRDAKTEFAEGIYLGHSITIDSIGRSFEKTAKMMINKSFGGRGIKEVKFDFLPKSQRGGGRN